LIILAYQAHMALKDVDSAVESFKKALELEPNDGSWFNQSSTYVFYFLFFLSTLYSHII